jgi:hypothetical protein
MSRPVPPVPAPGRWPSLDPAAVARTADFIAGVQEQGGQIPWFRGGRTDPWDHVEAAMGLDVAGRHDQARAAYEWLRVSQNPDGSWFRGYQGQRVVDPVRESNFTAYVGTGLWHHYLATGDAAFLHRLWPTLVAAVDYVLDLQAPGGQIRWARGVDGTAAAEALLTGCASVYLSLRCALAIARVRGEAQPDWELAATSLRHAIAAHPERFAPRERYAMDWYYPVLGGAVRGAAGQARLAGAWSRFVVPGLGVRCVADQPWTTVAETCELVLALAASGNPAAAREMLATVHHLRNPDGSYWTGYVYPDDAIWPRECTTWTAAAVLLAGAMLDGHLATAAVFTGDDLPAGPDGSATVCTGNHGHARR